ncbi:MAG TPA: hypothetical protein ENJ82_05080, partial [Bacteroidetes bacterium]|nr:hypothetical protein [Bacteroidota bacterium]
MNRWKTGASHFVNLQKQKEQNGLNWKILMKEYRNFLRVERGLAGNTCESYLHDTERYRWFMEEQKQITRPLKVATQHIRDFIHFLVVDAFLNERSLSRNISSVRSFHSFLVHEDYTDNDPTELLESPKLAQKLPVVLSVEEIDKILAQIDMRTKLGLRNRAMLELLYASGLRVSE